VLTKVGQGSPGRRPFLQKSPPASIAHCASTRTIGS